MIPTLFAFLSAMPDGSNPAVDFLRASSPNRDVPNWLYSWHDLARYIRYRKADERVLGAARRAFLDYRQSVAR